jgi:glycosyltransferase involved in cell wall biosynthesis
MSVCLIAVVKDEAEHIERCLRSAKPLIDRWAIVDTGSSDDTTKIIRRVMKGVPGKLLSEPFVNFRDNRTRLMELGRESGADYNLMLDADLEIQGTLPELTMDVYRLMIHDRALRYRLPLLSATRKPFRYEGVVHSYLACSEPFDEVNLDTLVILDHGGGGRSPGKLERDMELLRAEVAKDPSDRRSWFYLAQTYRDLDMVNEAIDAYKMRAAMGGWEEEVYYAMYQAGTLLSEHRSAADGMTYLIGAWKLRPGRAEALRALSNVASNVADKIPYPSDVLFVSPGAYKHQPLSPDQVSAVIVTRGDVDLEPVLETLPFSDVVIWDNSKRGEDVKIYGRYLAAKEAKNDVIFSVDDDVLFTAYDKLLSAYEPGKIVTNMDPAWVEGAGYGDRVALVGAGALWDRGLPWRAFDRYLAEHPFDDDFLLECDFVFGTMTPFTRVDLGYESDLADHPDASTSSPADEAQWEHQAGRGAP